MVLESVNQLLSFNATAELFKACRTEQTDKSQKGGWMCLVPQPAEGEKDDYTLNYKHAPFSKVEHVRKHFYEGHWDFGVWDKKPKTLKQPFCTS